VNVPTLEGWNLLLGLAVAISCTTGIYAFLLGGLSRREGARSEIGITSTDYFRTQRQEDCKEYGDNSKRPLAAFHGPLPWIEKYDELGPTSQFVVEERPFFIRNIRMRRSPTNCKSAGYGVTILNQKC
jgi:hypothetical protein